MRKSTATIDQKYKLREVREMYYLAAWNVSLGIILVGMGLIKSERACDEWAYISVMGICLIIGGFLGVEFWKFLF